MSELLAFTVVGIVTGSIYAVAAGGLVLTYTTSGIFNFAHGAIGMVMAFLYWELHVRRGWPAALALLVVVVAVAPATGAVVERLLLRDLDKSSTGTSLVVTVGLLLTLLGLASTVWDPSVARTVPEFFPGRSVRFASVTVTWHQLLTVTAAAIAALSLRLLLYSTRAGMAMRAVVDDSDLAELYGASTARISTLSWALGASFAAIAGILLAPLLALDVFVLTFLVINGYAAAMVGGLTSLPRTFAGAVALGLLEAYTVGYVSGGLGFVSRLKPALPTLFLIIVLLALPRSRLPIKRVVNARFRGVPGLKQSLLRAGAFVLIASGVAVVSSDLLLVNASQGMALAIMMLSLVVLTGYGGQVSLCQMTFVGLGAFVMGSVGGGDSLVGLMASAAVAAAVGALVALPALRLQGLYLALVTLAFAGLADAVVFNDPRVFGVGGALRVGRLALPFVSVEGDRAYFVLLAATFALLALGVLALRRSRFGRLLSAMSDSPAACATIGLNLTFTKTGVFALSAAMAGVAGALYGGLRTSVTPNDFLLLQSLVLLLLAYLGGINSITGAFLGGMVFALLPALQQEVAWLRALTVLGAGLGAITLGRNPEGMAGALRIWGDRIRARAQTKPSVPVTTTRKAESLAPG